MIEEPFVKMYQLQPKEGMTDDLIVALRALAASLADIDECLSCTMLAGHEPGETVVFMERWRSAAGYRSASSQIDGSLFAPFARLLATKPQVHELAEVPLTA